MSPNYPDAETKQAVWQAYNERKSTRVPLRWDTNSRVILLNPELNRWGYDYARYFSDPLAHLQVQSRWHQHLAEDISQVSDMSGELPEQWPFHCELQNVYDAAYLGAEVEFREGQVPDTRPFLTLDTLDEFMARDFSDPEAASPWLCDRLAFHERLVAEAETFEYLGRKGTVAPLAFGFDGPLTVAVNILGQEIFTLLAIDPDRAVAFMRAITDAAIVRNQWLTERAGGPAKGEWGWAADDCVQLISTEMYLELIAPIHEHWYASISETTPATRKRSIHLCGDATRHFPAIAERLGVEMFDTGFPVDFGALREALGPDVEISGGPHIALLRDGSPEDCAARTREILTSGIRRGGRFILQEGNNLPPCVPMANLRAVYETCLEHGRIDEN